MGGSVQSGFSVEKLLSEVWIPIEEQQENQSCAECQQGHNETALEVGYLQSS
jgi:hypothetical protein